MPFEQVEDALGQKVEIFKGVVDFVNVKELDPAKQHYGKTHFVSILVDSNGTDKKSGSWIALGGYVEDRLRNNNTAVSVCGIDDNWYDLCKGFEIIVPVTRNDKGFIKAQMKSLRVVKAVEASEAPARNSGAGGGKAPAKKGKFDTTNIEVGHSVKGAAELYAKCGMDFDEGMVFVHDTTTAVKDWLRENNEGGLDEFNIGMNGGMAVNAALVMIEKAEDLEKFAINILRTRVPLIRDYITSGVSPFDQGSEEPAQAETTESEDEDIVNVGGTEQKMPF